MSRKRKGIFTAQAERMIGSTCPRCGEKTDGATGLSFSDPRPQPEPGCITVCLKCGAFCVFMPDLMLREATVDELRRIEVDDQWSELLEIAASVSLNWRKKNAMEFWRK